MTDDNDRAYDAWVEDGCPDGIDWNFVPYTPACPLDGGDGVQLGSLGSRAWFRCRDCGIDFSTLGIRS